MSARPELRISVSLLLAFLAVLLCACQEPLFLGPATYAPTPVPTNPIESSAVASTPTSDAIAPTVESPSSPIQVEMEQLQAAVDAAAQAFEFETALGLLDQLIALDEAHAPAYQQRCMIHATRAEYDQALIDCNRAVDLDPGNVSTTELRAAVQLSMGNLDAGVADLRRVIELDGERATPHFFLALVLEGLEEYDAALDHVRTFIALQGDTPAEPGMPERTDGEALMATIEAALDRLATASPYDGEWYGTTEQDQAVYLQIESGGIRAWSVGFVLSGCESFSPVQFTYGQPTQFVGEDGFAVGEIGASITGTFLSEEAAIGTFSFGPGICGDGVITATWEAGRTQASLTPVADSIIALIPDFEIPDDLFAPQAGMSRLDENTSVVYEQDDWYVVHSWQECYYPIPKGWWTFVGIDATEFTIFGESGRVEEGEADIIIYLGSDGYRGDDRSAEEVVASILEIPENYSPDAPRPEIRETVILDNDHAYVITDWPPNEQQGEEANVQLLVLAENVNEGFWYTGQIVAPVETWETYYPIVREIFIHWALLDGTPIGMVLPEQVPARAP